MKILKYILILAVVIAASCKSDKYISNRFAGTYEITKYTSQLWDSTGMISATEYPCNYIFYLSANGNEFGDAPGKMDTSGIEPLFLEPLGLNNYSGLNRFLFEWNIGTSDNYRLSLLKFDGLVTNTSLVTLERNKLGRVKAFTYVKVNSDGTYYYEIYDVKVKH